MKKIYLCHPISTTGEFNDSIRVAEEMEKLGFEVYAPARNKAINDKSNNPTPQMIYEQDVERLLEADIIVMNLTGGDSDGTILEAGILMGMFESNRENLPVVFAYSSNKRALQPQHHNGIASGKLNHMVLGGIDKHFTWCGDEHNTLQRLKNLV